MDLKLKDVAELLNVSKTTIRRWLADGKIPAYRINNQYRFNRNEIEDWVMRHRVESAKIQTPPKVPSRREAPCSEKFPTPSGGIKQFSLYRAIHKGGVLHDVADSSKDELIRSAMKAKAQELNLDADVLADLLLDRERLMPTALSHGVGVPHTRDFLLDGQQDVVIVAFPPHPIDYGALDNEPVHTLFFLFACNDKRHLHLLAKIAHLCSQEHTQELLRSRPDKNALLDHIREWEGQFSLACGSHLED